MAREYYVLDVFTDTTLTGNPLAVLPDASGLDGAVMQAIAREFNLSETVFVLPPQAPRHRAQLRIFTPAYELPFAGHPVIGAACLLELINPGPTKDVAFGVELLAGVTSCVVERLGEGRAYARFHAPKLPKVLDGALTPDIAGAALGLAPGRIGYTAHAPLRVDSGGSVFQIAPVRTLADLAAAAPTGAFAEAFGKDLCYLYAPAEDADRADLRARMFAPQAGVPEDPATGSAATALAAALLTGDHLGDGTHDYVIRQGVEMGRPSRIALQIRVTGGAIDLVEIGGEALIVAQGRLRV